MELPTINWEKNYNKYSFLWRKIETSYDSFFLQIIPVQTIIDARESNKQFQLLKNIAFSVFTSCRWNLSHSVLGRSLTGFGPAAAADVHLKRKESVSASQTADFSRSKAYKDHLQKLSWKAFELKGKRIFRFLFQIKPIFLVLLLGFDANYLTFWKDQHISYFISRTEAGQTDL